ncbi:MAG: hypothetical protein COW00_19195 [Bdellovibrio sp. CG12_big_fil_rev_8_21_14_0_65_39_13]|nr:MAG: hypothetical protein COW78_17080 [Bdellovibrio sp. CG22_combo_CG10-13_8_21_14_all_39_27]PIQ57823.1 MAG: hypothetical protein COW00_19195 [Bdellovibrio sp. CG12_big_fil_rev_8_21_14_0_65_39_13]PIR34697.1 MAG: hypothetical protein COV37_12245 [Bdellovibrio sp. CG11_big_fil_rev_8_21_14_0_20_39_38]
MTKKAIIVALTFILMGCSKKAERQHPTLSDMGFSASKVTQTSIDQDTTGEWALMGDLKNASLIGLQTCLKDPLLAPLYQEPVKVVTPYKTHQVVADANGCLQWNEWIEFNPLAQQDFMEYPVEILNSRNNQAMIELPLMVNPWKSRDNVRDLRYDETPESHKSSKLDEASPFKVVAVSFKQLSPVRGRNGQSLLPFHAEFRLQVERLDEFGKIVRTDIKQANLETKLTLIDNNSKVIGMSSQSSRSQNGSFVIDGEMPIINNLTGLSSLEVIFNIQLPMTKFPALSVSLPMAGIEGGSVAEARPVEDPSKVEELRSDAIMAQAVKKDEEDAENDVSASQSFIVTRIDARAGSLVSDSYQKTSRRTQRTRLSLCLADSISSSLARPLGNIDFKVTSDVGTIEQTEKRTQANGCSDISLLLDYDLFDCENFIPVKLTIKGTGELEGHQVTREVAVNPWNDADYFYDIERQGAAPKLACVPPTLFMSGLSFINQGLVRSELKVDRYLQLNLKRRYQIQLNPQVLVGMSSLREQAPRALSFGRIKTKISLYAPTTDQLDYLNPKASDLMFLSSTEAEGEINAGGQVLLNIDLPFDVADTHLLSHKNIIIIELSSDQFSKVEKSTFLASFIAGSSQGTMSATKADNKLIEQLAQIKKSSVEPLKQSPVAIYRDYLTSIQKENHQFKSFEDFKSLNEERPLGTQDWQLGRGMNKERYFSELSFEETRMMARENGKLPSETLKKLCRHFYQIPQIKRELRSLGGINYVADGGSLFLKCVENPRAYINVLGMTFIDKLMKEKEGMAPAKFIADNNGKLNRGKGYFAGSGERSGVDHTTSEGESWMLAFGGEFGFPNPFSFGMEGGYARTYAISDSKSVGSSQMAMVRYGSNQDDLNLNYESLTLEVIAETKECFTAGAQKALRTIQVCLPESRLQKIQETWYFIEESVSANNGVIADGTRPGQDYLAQVVRGQDNFNRIWDKFVYDDNAMIVQNLDQLDIFEAFRPFLKDSPAEYLFEKNKDNSIPGAIIKTVRNPHSNTVGTSSRNP